MKINSIAIFISSIFSSAVALMVERMIGIGWDYHPDSVTYATNSTNTVQSILDDNPILIFNNLHYFVCHLLGEDIILITIMNMVIYSITNSMLASLHNSAMQLIDLKKSFKLILLMLLLANPYRLHLSTTLLKDTWIIFLLTAMLFHNGVRSYLALILMSSFRIASILYVVTKFNQRQFKILLILSILALPLFYAGIVERALEFNDAEMQLREFDSIPTFRDFGILGVVIRAVLWPALAITGVFALISPALPFIAVALGSIMNNIYTLMSVRTLCIEPKSYIILGLFAGMVTGFTAYIRYIYPVMSIMPLMVIFYHGNKK